VRGAAAGRVVSAYDSGDTLLRAASLWWGLGGVPAGLAPVGGRAWWLGGDGVAAPPAQAPPRPSPQQQPRSRSTSSTTDSSDDAWGSAPGAWGSAPGAYDTPSRPVADVSAEQLACIPSGAPCRGSALAAGTVFAQWWEGVESVDVSGIVGGHGAWEAKLPDVLAFLGVA
jgi:hypothetical protein